MKFQHPPFDPQKHTLSEPCSKCGSVMLRADLNAKRKCPSCEYEDGESEPYPVAGWSPDPLDGVDWWNQFCESVDDENKPSVARALLLWLSGDDLDYIDKRSIRRIGLRVVALVWATNPAWIDGSTSEAHLAKRIGVDKTGLSRVVAQATSRFGVHNRAQAHGDGVRKK